MSSKNFAVVGAVEDRMHAILKAAQDAAMAVRHEFSVLLMKLPKQARTASASTLLSFITGYRSPRLAGAYGLT